ncbi:MAG: DUF5659 domain-containing protein [Minisyncoccia bacterium]
MLIVLFYKPSRRDWGFLFPMSKTKISKKDDRYFRISSFYVAAFLFAKGLELVNVDKITNPKRAQFVFRDSPEREILVNGYNFAKEDSPEAIIDVRKFVMAIKMLKDKLYQDQF